jgi:hypothetical protein
MRYFTLLDFQHMLLALFLGVTAVILVYLAFGSYARHQAAERQGPEETLPGDVTGEVHEGQENPLPAFLKVVYAGIIATAVGYMVFIGMLGAPF